MVCIQLILHTLYISDLFQELSFWNWPIKLEKIPHKRRITIETVLTCFKEIGLPEDLEKLLLKFIGFSLKILRHHAQSWWNHSWLTGFPVASDSPISMTASRLPWTVKSCSEYHCSPPSALQRPVNDSMSGYVRLDKNQYDHHRGLWERRSYSALCMLANPYMYRCSGVLFRYCGGIRYNIRSSSFGKIWWNLSLERSLWGSRKSSHASRSLEFPLLANSGHPVTLD